MNLPLERRWIQVTVDEPPPPFTEAYAFSAAAATQLEGLLIRPADAGADTVFLMMHPAATLNLLPLPEALARAGYPVLCMGSRYARNDAPLIYEKVALDLGACVRHARQSLGFRRVVLLGWSGGGSLALFYQSQAASPSITHTPAADPVDLVAARLPEVDGIVLNASHQSRASMLCDWIDPSVLDESNPDRRDPRFDLYSPELPVRPPYPADWLRAYRAAQRQRVRRITSWVEECLHTLRQRGGAEVERGFVTHRTLADPRFLDPDIDPNDRRPGHCYLGRPETANTGPAGLARFSTLRSWLSQWSIDHTRADGARCAAQVHVPLLAIEHGADDAVPQPEMGILHRACASADKRLVVIPHATHLFQGQPAQLHEAVGHIATWARQRDW